MYRLSPVFICLYKPKKDLDVIWNGSDGDEKKVAFSSSSYIFFPFFPCLCIFRPLFSAPIRRVTYIDLGKSSQQIWPNIASSSSMLSKLYFIFSSSPCFVVFSDGRRRAPRKKETTTRKYWPLKKSRFIASRENLKIFSYKFVYFEQETRKGKGTETVHTLWQLRLYSEKHIKCCRVIATLFSEKAVLAVSTRRIDRLTDVDW